MTDISDSYGMLYNCMIIDPISKLHIYVLPFEVFGGTTKIVVPYSTCMMLADIYQLEENNTDKDYMNSNVSCVSYRRFRTQDQTEPLKCYNDVELARDAIYSKYATYKNEYGREHYMCSNIVTDILITQFNRYIGAEVRDSNRNNLPEYKPIALIYLKSPTEYDSSILKKLHSALAPAIMSITIFWQDTMSMLAKSNMMYKYAIRSNFMKAVTTVELVRLQQKAQLGLKIIRDTSCLVIVHDQSKFMHAFCYHIDRLVVDSNREKYHDEILDLAKKLIPEYACQKSSLKIDIFYLPALRAYGMAMKKIQDLTLGFLHKWCDGLTIAVGDTIIPIDADVVQSILMKFAYVMIGSMNHNRSACEANEHLIYGLTPIDINHVDIVKALLRMKEDIFRLYFLNIYSAYFVHLFSGVDCNPQTFYQSDEAIRLNLAATMSFVAAEQIGDEFGAEKFRKLVKQDLHLYLKMINSIRGASVLNHPRYVSDGSVLGRCLLYASEEKNENLICSEVTAVDCPVIKFSKKMNTQRKTAKEQETSSSISHNFTGANITISHNTNAVNFAPIDYKLTQNVVSEIEHDVMSFAAKVAATIIDRMGDSPSPTTKIPQDEYRNRNSPANNVPNVCPNKKYNKGQQHKSSQDSFNPSPSSSQQPTISRSSHIHE